MTMARTDPRPRSDSPITAARISAGLTQAQLAEKIGCLQNDISRWENGRRHPSVDSLAALASALGVPIEQLITPKP